MFVLEMVVIVRLPSMREISTHVER